MKLIIKMILLMFILSCCSSKTIRFNPKKKGVDPEFDVYIDSYTELIQKDKNFSEYKERFSKLSVNFVYLEENKIGRCYWLGNGGYEIEIDKRYWDDVPDQAAREFLVYHELEHCIRFRMHTHKKESGNTDFLDFIEEIMYKIGFIKRRGYFSDGCPDSIMHPFAIGYYCRNRHYIKYIQEIIDWEPL